MVARGTISVGSTVKGTFETALTALHRSRFCSGQSALEPFGTTAFNTVAATHSIESSYFSSISTRFNKSLKLVRDQGVGGSNPLSPTIFRINQLQTIAPFWNCLAKGSFLQTILRSTRTHRHAVFTLSVLPLSLHISHTDCCRGESVCEICRLEQSKAAFILKAVDWFLRGRLLIGFPLLSDIGLPRNRTPSNRVRIC
jgi:hypothetical protein